MKRLIIFILIVITINGYSKDYHKTEEIINGILSEESDSKKLIEKKDSTPVTADKIEQQEEGDDKKKSMPSMTGQEEVLLKTGIQLYESGMYSHSQANFNELLKNFPSSTFSDSARIWSGKIDIKKYRYDDAISKFSKIKKNSGEYPASIYYTAESYRYKGSDIPAIEQHQKLASSYPDHELADDSILISGRLYMKINKGYQALESAIRVIRYYSTRETVDDAYYLIAKIYEKDPILKDIETARKLYRKFLMKAERGDKYFASSPILTAVKRDLNHLEKNYFRQER